MQEFETSAGTHKELELFSVPLITTVSGQHSEKGSKVKDATRIPAGGCGTDSQRKRTSLGGEMELTSYPLARNNTGTA
jgi:hypothetical protein